VKESQLRELAADFLVPLFSGVQLDSAAVPSTLREDRVALLDPCAIGFKASSKDNYRLVLRRSQPFGKVRAGTLSESDVVRAFVNVVGNMEFGLRQWYSDDLRIMFPRRVVARTLCGTKAGRAAVLAALDQLTDWASRQYEGKSIAAAVGFVPDDNPGAVDFAEMCKRDFSMVMSNGLDTLLTCNMRGQVVGYDTLTLPSVVTGFAPYRLVGVAHWAGSGKIAVTLNRTGEILVFRDHELRFARRAGRWHFLTPAQVIITQMGGPQNHPLRHAVYETAIDASFARTGACIGIVTSGHMSEWTALATLNDDWLTPAVSVKAKAVAQMVGGKLYHQLDRRLRQELAAIDGATVLGTDGTLLAVGAILDITGGSTGGGRRAAALALSRLGVGIKISQDGGIEGFHEGSSEPRFRVMK